MTGDAKNGKQEKSKNKKSTARRKCPAASCVRGKNQKKTSCSIIPIMKPIGMNINVFCKWKQVRHGSKMPRLLSASWHDLSVLRSKLAAKQFTAQKTSGKSQQTNWGDMYTCHDFCLSRSRQQADWRFLTLISVLETGKKRGLALIHRPPKMDCQTKPIHWD